MDLELLWAEASASLDTPLHQHNIRHVMLTESTSQTAELTRRLAIQRNYAYGFLVIFTGLLYVVWEKPAGQFGMFAAIAIYAAGGGVLHRGVAKLQALARRPMVNTRQHLAEELRLIEQTLTLNKLWAVVSFPVFMVCGLLVGYALRGNTSTVFELLRHSGFLLSALAAVVIGLPLAYWAGDRMTQSAFDELLSSLRQNLYALEKLESAARQ